MRWCQAAEAEGEGQTGSPLSSPQLLHCLPQCQAEVAPLSVEEEEEEEEEEANWGQAENIK